MKTILFICLLLNSIYSIANVSSGDQIKAVEYNNSKFTIGDIKTSILPLDKFQELHGSCWIQLNQGASNSNISISGTDLSVALGNIATIKSSSGRVLRSQGGNSSSLGMTQEDATAVNGLSTNTAGSHYHLHGGPDPAAIDSDYRRYGITDTGVRKQRPAGSSSESNYAAHTSNSGNHTHSLSGDNETRMENLTVNTFIKVNHSCN